MPAFTVRRIIGIDGKAARYVGMGGRGVQWRGVTGRIMLKTCVGLIIDADNRPYDG